MSPDERARPTSARASTAREGAGLRRASITALSAAAILVLSLGIAWPLWSLATSARGVYNAIVAALAFAALIALIVRRRRSRLPRGAARR